MTLFENVEAETSEFYVCPHHQAMEGWEPCCDCGGWEEGDPDFGRYCTEANEQGETENPLQEQIATIIRKKVYPWFASSFSGIDGSDEAAASIVKLIEGRTE